MTNKNRKILFVLSLSFLILQLFRSFLQFLQSTHHFIESSYLLFLEEFIFILRIRNCFTFFSSACAHRFMVLYINLCSLSNFSWFSFCKMFILFLKFIVKNNGSDTNTHCFTVLYMQLEWNRRRRKSKLKIFNGIDKKRKRNGKQEKRVEGISFRLLCFVDINSFVVYSSIEDNLRSGNEVKKLFLFWYCWYR